MKFLYGPTGWRMEDCYGRATYFWNGVPQGHIAWSLLYLKDSAFDPEFLKHARTELL